MLAFAAMASSLWGRVSVGLLGLSLSGCIDTLSEQQSTVGEKKRDCVVPLPVGVSALGAPVSLEYPGASLLIWDSALASDGRQLFNLSARVSSSAELCANGPALSRDGSGQPQSLLVLSRDELAANAARTDGRELALIAGGGFVSDAVGYLYYEHALRGPGPFDSENLGTGLCVVSDPDEPCERLTVDGDSRLWPPSAWPKNQGGLVDGSQALLLGCRHVASFEDPCVLSGVPLDQIRNPDAYRYYNAFNGWQAAPEAASVIFNQAGATTLTSVDGRYAATNLSVFDAAFSLRFAAQPTAGFDHPIALFRGAPPESGLAQGGREHRGLHASERSLSFSYFVDQPGAQYGLHAIEFELHRGLH